MHLRWLGLIVTMTLLLILSLPLRAAGPVPVSPGSAMGGEIHDACPTFSWSEVDGARGYELVVYSAGSEAEAVQPLVSVRFPERVQSWTPSAQQCLQRGAEYAWSVRALKGRETAEWSEPVLFEVAAAPTVGEVEAAIATLRKYLEENRMRDGEARSSENLPRRAAKRADGEGTSPTRPGPAAATAPPRSEERQTGSSPASKDAPSFSTASLTVSDQVHLGPESAFFKDGDLFLWDDATAGNLSLGRDALVVAGGEATNNTALGRGALQSTTGTTYPFEASGNTAVGSNTLMSNTSGRWNTATGYSALFYNVTGEANTATGVYALEQNTGFSNTAVGAMAMRDNGIGSLNTAVGIRALANNTWSQQNTAIGGYALLNNTTGGMNTATGFYSLNKNEIGGHNTALGWEALVNSTSGSRNVGVGSGAGGNLGYIDYPLAPQTSLSDNVFIASPGEADEEKTIRIGTAGTHERTFVAGIHGVALDGSNEHTVCVDDAGQLGPCSVSSRQFKKDVRDLQQPTRQLLDLRPVTFRFRKGILGGADRTRVGLIAEEVAEVFPELVVRGKDGEPFGVRYELLSVVLLSELQRQYRTVQEHEQALEELDLLRARLTALEEGKRPPEAETSWWRRVFGVGR